MQNKYGIRAALILLGVYLAPGAWAQDGEKEEAVVKKRLPSHMEEVIVSARKRDESVQDIPLSVTPFTMQQMERRAFNGVEDIAASTPGFSYEGFSTAGTNGNAVIRGLAQQFTTSRIQNVAFFIDGVYMQRQSMLNMGLIDMQRVEVVKGPQNALYGRNAFAGALNYVTSRPTVEPSGYISQTVGSHDRLDLRASYTGPIFSDKFLGKISYGQTEYDGHHRNDHTQADANPSGPSTQGRLGGWDDQSYAAAFTFDASEKFSAHLGLYHVEIIRETAPAYMLSGIGAREFGLWEQDDLNCITGEGTQFTAQGPTDFEANTAYCGALPSYAAEVAPRSFGPTGLVVDPRSWGADASTDLLTLAFDWSITENLQLSYLFGWTDHDSSSTGGPGGEDPEVGQSAELALGLSHVTHLNSFSSRPNSVLESFSHEFRFDWQVTDWFSARFGTYYSEVDDRQWTLLFISPVCSSGQNLDAQGDPIGSSANCDVALGGAISPIVSDRGPTDISFVVPYDLGFRQHAHNRAEDTSYSDGVEAIFVSFDIDFTETLSMSLEGRYTHENKQVVRHTDSFGIAFGEVIDYSFTDRVFGVPPTGCADPQTGIDDGLSLCSALVAPNDEENFHYFTPRAIFEWKPSDDNMVYVSAAKGVKSGGFNNAVDQTQQTFDEASNWTYEIGTKNKFFDKRLTLNMALYQIEWTGLQGGVTPNVVGLSTSDVTENLGEAKSTGAESEIKFRFTDSFSTDIGLSYNDPKYGDGVKYSPAVSKFQCEKTDLCADDGEVGGNQLARTSKIQVNAGLNYNIAFNSGWMVNARYDINYQSRQYVTPLNLAWAPERIVSNASINILDPNDHWEFNLWGKNIFDEDKAANAFYIGVFNQYMAAKLAGPSYGLQIKYNL
ncbi:MAG: TonB-dependent receptor [Spongiibacteraceae bacterium]